MSELSEKDVNFLRWIENRLLFVHKEPANVDYMHRLRKVLDKIERRRFHAKI